MDTATIVVNAVLGAGIIQGIFLAVLIFRKKSGTPTANRILGLLMLAFALNIAHPLLAPGLFFPAARAGGTWAESFQYLLGPMVFLYIRATAASLEQPGEEKVFRPRHLLHFAPFVCATGLLAAERLASGGPFALSSSDPGGFAVDLVFWAGCIAQSAVYIILCFIRLSRFRRRLEQEYSSLEKRTLDWMHWFLIAFLAIAVVYLVLLSLRLHGHAVSFLPKVGALALSAAVYGIGWRGLTQAERAAGTEIRPTPKAAPPTEMKKTDGEGDGKYAKSGLSEGDLADLATRLRGHLAEKKPWLDPELSLGDLAAGLDLSRNQLSLVINRTLGTTFYNLINSCRLEETKTILADPARRRDKILAVALDAGFASKAVFNRFFKAVTGVTPGAYRDRALAG